MNFTNSILSPCLGSSTFQRITIANQISAQQKTILKSKIVACPDLGVDSKFVIQKNPSTHQPFNQQQTTNNEKTPNLLYKLYKL